MKRIVLFSLVLMLVFGASAQDAKKANVVSGKAQTEAKNNQNGYEIIEIQTNGTCQKCQELIMSNAPFWKGVKDCRYDMKTSKVRVVYDPTTTTPHRIRQAISKLGYDADDVKADAEARAKLPESCRTEKNNTTCSGDHKNCSHSCSHSCPNAKKSGNDKALKSKNNEKKEQPKTKKSDNKKIEKSAK